MSDQPDRALLVAKSRDDLVAMAEALGIEIAPRARKATIIDDILKGPSAVQEGPDDEGTVRRVRRTAETSDSDLTATESSDVSDDSKSATAGQNPDEESSKDDRDADEPAIGEPGNRRRRRRGSLIVGVTRSFSTKLSKTAT